MGKRTNTAAWLENQKRWQIKVQKDNERRTFTSSKPGRTGQREANAKADAWLDDNISGQNIKISKLYADYIANLKLTTSKSNWRPIEEFGKNRLIPKIGNIKIENITEQHLQNILNQSYADNLAYKTISNHAAFIRGFFKYCRKCKTSTLHPENLKINQNAAKSQKRILNPAELKILFAVETTKYNNKIIVDKYINAYRFEVVTGLRPGETAGLRWQDIDSEYIYINRAINIYNEETAGKNQNAIRHFALTALAKTILAAQRAISKTESVFEISSQGTYSKRWNIYCIQNGIHHISLYEMRHTFVSIAKNLNQSELKQLVGHSKNMDTLGVYGHEREGELQETATRVNILFENILYDDENKQVG